jgi:hypothetical protein
MRYVIRSMSTTDYEPYSHEPVRPYQHLSDAPGTARARVLVEPARRSALRQLPEGRGRGASSVPRGRPPHREHRPEDDRAYPTYWEISN